MYFLIIIPYSLEAHCGIRLACWAGCLSVRYEFDWYTEHYINGVESSPCKQHKYWDDGFVSLFSVRRTRVVSVAGANNNQCFEKFLRFNMTLQNVCRFIIGDATPQQIRSYLLFYNHHSLFPTGSLGTASDLWFATLPPPTICG